MSVIEFPLLRRLGLVTVRIDQLHNSEFMIEGFGWPGDIVMICPRGAVIDVFRLHAWDSDMDVPCTFDGLNVELMPNVRSITVSPFQQSDMEELAKQCTSTAKPAEG